VGLDGLMKNNITSVSLREGRRKLHYFPSARAGLTKVTTYFIGYRRTDESYELNPYAPPPVARTNEVVAVGSSYRVQEGIDKVVSRPAILL
jgi:hypothetical protein